MLLVRVAAKTVSLSSINVQAVIIRKSGALQYGGRVGSVSGDRRESLERKP